MVLNFKYKSKWGGRRGSQFKIKYTDNENYWHTNRNHRFNLRCETFLDSRNSLQLRRSSPYSQ